MDEVIRSSKFFKGYLRVPGDKSISHRALILGSIAEGETEIVDFLDSEDVRATIDCLKRLGVNIEQKNNSLKVLGVGKKGFSSNGEILNCQNSGTTMRLFMGLLCAQKNLRAELIGDDSLLKRPMKRVSVPLKKMGADIKLLDDERAPVKIEGQSLTGIDYELPVASAQVKSAIILAALYAKGETKISGKIYSRDHTERLLPLFGGKMSVSENEIRIHGDQTLIGTKVVVPGDLSTAAFWMVAASLVEGGEIILENVSLNPTRMGLIHVMRRMGAKIETKIISDKGEPVGEIKVVHAKLHGVLILEDEVPALVDEIPLIAILATQAEGETIVRGASELRVKESDRIDSLEINLKAMGVEIEAFHDGFRIKGKQKLKGGLINSFHDHRIAMAFSIAALIAQGETRILHSECVSVSYPDFYLKLKELTTPIACVIGNPVSQSISGAIFYYFSNLTHQEITYRKEQVTLDQLNAFLNKAQSFVGLNVTLPLKQAIIPFLDEVSDEAKVIKAVNVVKIVEDKMIGYNSDVFGIEQSLKNAKFKNVLLIGAGGAARSAIMSCEKLGAQNLFIYNPRSARGEKLQSEFESIFSQVQLKTISVQDLVNQEFDLVINATPVGMGEGTIEANSFFNFLPRLKKTSEALAFDLIYFPIETPFLKIAKGSGFKTLGGLSMLIDQALKTWGLWFDDLELDHDHRLGLVKFLTALLKLKESGRPLCLTGFMGVGKTTIGKTLTELLGWTFIDIDQEIEKELGLRVAEIFSQRGEAFFREIEARKVQESLKLTSVVISLGGGSLIHAESLRNVLLTTHLIHLSSDLDEIYNRQKKSMIIRPLLNFENKEVWMKNATDLFEARRAHYERAVLEIKTDQLSPREVIISMMQELGRVL